MSCGAVKNGGLGGLWMMDTGHILGDPLWKTDTIEWWLVGTGLQRRCLYSMDENP